jgi:hypothetical protein
VACKRCTGEHFNFVSCEDHAAKVADQKRRERSPERFLRLREGERDFGNRIHSSETNGFNVVYIPRKSHPLYKES